MCGVCIFCVLCECCVCVSVYVVYVVCGGEAGRVWGVLCAIVYVCVVNRDVHIQRGQSKNHERHVKVKNAFL